MRWLLKMVKDHCEDAGDGLGDLPGFQRTRSHSHGHRAPRHQDRLVTHRRRQRFRRQQFHRIRCRLQLRKVRAKLPPRRLRSEFVRVQQFRRIRSRPPLRPVQEFVPVRFQTALIDGKCQRDIVLRPSISSLRRDWPSRPLRLSRRRLEYRRRRRRRFLRLRRCR